MTDDTKNPPQEEQAQLPHNVMSDPRGAPVTFTLCGQPKSYLYEMIWNFSSEEMGRRHTVSFVNVNAKYVKVIQETLFKIKLNVTQKEKVPPNSSLLASDKIGLMHISEALGHTNWSALNNAKAYKRFKRRLKEMKLGKGTIESNVVPVLNRIYNIGYINIIINGRELIQLATSKPIKQAISIPIAMYQQLLSKALEVVEKHHEYRYEISKVMQEAYDLRERIHNGEVIFKNSGENISMNERRLNSRLATACKNISHNIPDFKVKVDGSSLTEIQAACAIVILAFSGVRVGELFSFNKASYKDKKIVRAKRFTILSIKPLRSALPNIGVNYYHRDNFTLVNTIATLTGKTTKGNDGIPKTATWQTHPVVKMALELAEDATQSIRNVYLDRIQEKFKSGEYNEVQIKQKLSEAQSAFIAPDALRAKNSYVSSSLDRMILNQAKLWGIRATQEDVEEFDLLNESRLGTLRVGGFLPKLSPHDFRRTFAVFFRRYNFGSSAGIMFQYKQNNINMAKYYENNAELMHISDVLMDVDLLNELEKAGIDLGVDIYDEIYNSENLSGLGGEVIAKERAEKLKNGHDVYMTREEIREHVSNGDFAIVQLPTGGYCTNTSCERLCGITQFKAEQKPCPHQVYTDKSAKKLAQQRKRLIEQFRGMNNGDSLQNSILAGLKQKIQDVEITLKQHNVSHESFLDIIKGAAA